MDDWLSKDYVVNIQDLSSNVYNVKEKLSNLNIVFSDKPSRTSKSLVLIDLVRDMKDIYETSATGSRSDSLNNLSKISDNNNKFSNPYEKVSIISRSVNKKLDKNYFKLIEMLYFFKIGASHTSLHLCNNSNSFSKAISDYSKKSKESYSDLISEDFEHKSYIQTLSSSYEENIGSELNSTSSRLKSDETWIRDYDLCSIENIKNLRSKLNFEGSFDFITGSGIIKSKYDQEQYNLKLIYAEILTALHYQKTDGTFICKILDTYTKPTCQLIYLLTLYYSKVHIIKPRVNGFITSEKYIVSTGFLNIHKNDLDLLSSVMDKFKYSETENSIFCRDFGLDLDLDIDKDKNLGHEEFEFSDEFIKNIYKYNNITLKNQIKYLKFSNSISSEQDKKVIEAFQNKKANEFCEVFNIFKNSSLIHDCRHYSTRTSTVIGNNVSQCEKCLRYYI